MLEQSKSELINASNVEGRAAEAAAYRYLAAELEQDLVPAEEAARTVDNHREENSETWLRAVYAMLMGLLTVEAKGCSIKLVD